MLILPRQEVKRIGGEIDLDLVDIGRYFWTQLRAIESEQPRRVEPPQWCGHNVSRCQSDDVKCAMRAVVDWLAGDFVPREQGSSLDTRYHPIDQFRPDGKKIRTIEHRRCARLSTSLFTWPEELKAFGIEAEPGYLYLRVPHIPDGRLSSRDYSRLEEEKRPKLAAEWNSRTNTATISLDSMPKGMLRDLELLVNGIEITPPALVPEPKIVQKYDKENFGGRENIKSSALHYLRATGIVEGRDRVYREDEDWSDLRIGHSFRINQYPRVIKTPFEFPLGWVTDTASRLRATPGFGKTKFAKSFFAFVFSNDTLSRAMKHVPAKKKNDDFPFDEPTFSGADLAWRYSENPWLVQMVLFARLIGGRYMTQMFGSLALGFEKDGVDWSSPVFSSAPSLRRVSA